ncbi:hypothetical protein [Acrocarpospora sp. B8E8]|uniref:hypothetical protein n=1 Tax=Acrocarpospora sp. B8E8 TaxID=3153572 RepID=UPI00325D1CD8
MIDDIRSLGTIVAEESSEITWDGLTTITNVFVVDVNGSAATPSLNRAMDLLEEYGWESTHDRRPTSVAMLSSRLDASIYMEGFDDDAVSSPIGLAAKTADLAKKAQAKNSAERFLVIEASPYDVE